MTVSRKRKRRIDVDGRVFLWSIKEIKHDLHDLVASTGYSLNVVSEDGTFCVEYPLGQTEDRRHVVVKGSGFRDAQRVGGPWRRFLCPPFGSQLTISPRDVAQLIRWATSDADPQPVEVDYMGRPVVP